MKKKTSLEGLIEITKEVLQAKYAAAELAFLAGSIVRGKGTAFSDLDIVVIFENLPNAFRESFYYKNFPVETFVHTPETLTYFFEIGVESGNPSLAAMVSEGIEVPCKNHLSEKLKALANEVLAHPPEISVEEIRDFRCWITDLIDDIREPRSKAELTASAATLYAALANFYLRTNNFWSSKSKTIPRSLQKANPDFCRNFCESFEELFVAGKPGKVIELTEKLLAPQGGFLFEGIQLDAPANWQKSIA